MPHVYQLLRSDDHDAAPVVTLHGSGGNEHDLIPVARDLAPHSPIVALRGGIRWNGGFAFFRRFEDRTIDEADLVARLEPLADFTLAVYANENLGRRGLAIGFSNGAIMTGALVMFRPNLFSGVILFRPMSPFTRTIPMHHLGEIPVLILDGQNDQRRSPGDGRRLGECLNRMGAQVTHHTLPVGHAITASDIEIARAWIRSQWRSEKESAYNEPS